MSAVIPISNARKRYAWRAFALLAAALLALAFWAGGRVGRDAARADTLARARSSAELKVLSLLSELQRQRFLPLVLAGDEQLANVLRSRDPDLIAKLNLKLEALNQATGASVIYLLDTRGVGIAASNWREPTSFIGSDYSFRPYFQKGMSEGAAEHFALGNVSLQPGLYLTRRIGRADRPLGVIAVKVGFDALEENWRRFPDTVFVADEHGVVLLSSEPAWRFMTLAPLSAEERGRLRDSLQFGKAPLEPLPLLAAADAPRVADAREISASLPGVQSSQPYLHIAQAVPSTAWTFHILAPGEAAQARAAALGRATAMLLALCLLFAAGLLLYRSQRARNAAAVRAAARIELEETVQARTAQLRATNRQLQSEMEDRWRAETKLQKAQDELVQANKLAFLGQIAAGVAHEINQPVAAIRSYADNAEVYLDRGQAGPARANLRAIAELTQRLGRITDELRTFSRKAARSVGPTAIEPAIDGALILVSGQLRRQGLQLRRGPVPAGLAAMAEQGRLEQILVNLLQNAIEALAGRADGAIDISVADDGQQVNLCVRDNGPGIAPDIMAALFTPFVTSKSSGLGLGLLISRDIAADFGGALRVDSRPGDTRFTLSLNKAPQ
ncbi:sensor histidine kinase [Pollutimonas bauzanensis]|uniref:C4-dicarboxylate transport sensor protein DctB n=1 Tax=Pollutimonas bauzanensis TaxID=658167 RepID=A0A1M5Y3Y1_9BURK|nr:ATP-binding protein [Pollutimonas bauzanensis]SHI06712.1 two-component system, NtrC family, C4-dicarboxylate transport sensor histidine kinase DctB [Pollutimonas bauzanensis]